MATERFFLELEPPLERLSHQPHVVIVGGGFAGLSACKAFAGAELRVTLIDKRNFHLFQPLLYQVSTGLVAPGDVASPLRVLVGEQANVQVRLGEVTVINPRAQELVCDGQRLSYDHLILATGSGSSFFGHDDWRALATPMKQLEDALEIRRRLLAAMEEAEQTSDARQRLFLQSVVIVGGGPTGCELAGSISELMHHAMERDFKQLDPCCSRIVLVDPGQRLLRDMHPDLSAAAATYLQSVGVELLLGGRVRAIEPGLVRVATADGERVLEAATLCWTAGVCASPLGALLAEATGAACDRSGRLIVADDFSLPYHPEIRVVGDLCRYSLGADGQLLPGMAGAAVQSGAWVAGDIRRKREGRTRTPFHYNDFGSMAVLGPLQALADLRGLRFSGAIGWLLWGVAHLAFMPAAQNRFSLLTKWMWVIATRQRSSMLITSRPLPEPIHSA